MVKRLTATVMVLACLFAMAGAVQAAKVKVLIVDGQNGHNWKAGTPVMKEALEKTGRFEVSVATSPSKGEDMSGFKPAFADYDVILSNYDGDRWSRETDEAFLRYMQNGGGLVIVHAADNAFSGWDEYNKMIAVGGWGGRSDKSGPWVYWEDGKIVRDTSPGPGGGHGNQHAYTVINRVTDHPVTKGLPERWMHAKDELYHQLRGPAENMTILSTAWSDPATGGTGKHEPMLMAIAYGKGRVFHTVLGDNASPMQGIGFHVTLARGAEWAATGAVTLPVPEDFPAVLSPVDAVARYDFGSEEKPLTELRQTLMRESANAAAMAGYEASFVKILRDPRTSFAAVQFVCEQLAYMGSAASTDALAELLGRPDARFAHAARLALERMDCDQANQALIAGLSAATGAARIGVINSLGERGDARTVTALRPLAASGDAPVAQAAIQALGKIGYSAAIEALTALGRGSDPLVAGALIDCAYRIAGQPEGRAAASRVFESVLAEATSTSALRSAALRGMLISNPRAAMSQVWAMIEGGNQGDMTTAISLLSDAMPSKELVVSIAGRLDKVAPATQIALLGVLSAFGLPDAIPVVATAAAQHVDANVRFAAVKTLGNLPGDRQSVSLLAALATGDQAALKRPAHAALLTTPGSEAERAIIEGLGSSDPELCREYITVAGERVLAPASRRLLKLAKDSDESLRLAAFRALRKTADAEDYAALIALATGEQTDKVKREAARAVTYAGRKIDDPAKRSEPYLKALRRGDEATQVAFAVGLADLYTAEALHMAQQLALGKQEKVSDAAARALANWQEASGIGVVLETAARTESRVHRILLMRAFSRLATMPADLSVADRLSHCEAAIKIGLDVEAKRMLLSTLGNIIDVKSLDLIEVLAAEPALSGEASLAAAGIRQQLLGTPIVTASHQSQAAQNAVDGNPGTRWDSGAPMVPNMWVLVDLRLSGYVDAIQLDTTQSAGDYPRGYAVYVTDTPNDPGDPVAVGKGDGPVTRIMLDKPVKGQYVKIVQTDKIDGLFWSIHELTVDYNPGFPDAGAPVTKLADLAATEGLITAWDLAGPFFREGKSNAELFDIAFPPEVSERFAFWRRVEKQAIDNGVVDLNRIMNGENRVAYMRCVIEADKATDATLFLGSDDGIKVWLNGAVVHGVNAGRGMQVDQDQVNVTLQKGENRVLLKITQEGGGWAACARLKS